jgi:ribonucleoside-diphosphate reductase alpha chain
VTHKIYESAQFLYVLIGASLFSKFPKKKRLNYIRRFYEATSKFKLSLPTPIMAGVRTPTRQFSSCVLINTGDSLDSINASASSNVKYVSQRAGIGLNICNIRAVGITIRNGEAFHTGVIPFIKHFQTAVKSCSQGGVRGGAATLFYPLWHLEVESLLVLKNNRGVDDNRARHLDYGVQFNKMMYQRLIKDQNITLFSPSDVPGLYDAFFADQEKFDELYLKYEADDSIRKKTVKAIELFSLFAQERASTGRIYLQNVDNCNTHSPFNPKVAPIQQSNLCLEIALPSSPLQEVNDENGEIALCTLSAFNLGAIDSLDELEELAEIAVAALDSLLDYQDYPIPAAKRASLMRRTLGVGVINYAYYLAKNGVKYSDGSANKLTHETFEAIQFYLMKASNKLAKEFGPCEAFQDTTYSEGILPIDTYAKNVDTFCSPELTLDWEGLRSDIKTYGMRNSTLSALMPSETSSQISNATNGIEPPRGLVSVKASKDGILKQVVPDIKNLADQYETLWTIPDNNGYLELVAIMQKFIDQTISANTNYDPSKFEGGKVPLKVILRDILTAYKNGVKTLYYHNTRDGASDASSETTVNAKEVVEDEDDDCLGGACKI